MCFNKISPISLKHPRSLLSQPLSHSFPSDLFSDFSTLEMQHYPWQAHLSQCHSPFQQNHSLEMPPNWQNRSLGTCPFAFSLVTLLPTHPLSLTSPLPFLGTTVSAQCHFPQSPTEGNFNKIPTFIIWKSLLNVRYHFFSAFAQRGHLGQYRSPLL